MVITIELLPRSAISCSPRLISPAIFALTRNVALRATNEKFERRFSAIERALFAHGKTPQQSTLAEMDELWNEAKKAERAERTSISE